ncbi:LuxR C-terminal-related transcriptional regulator [Rhizobium sp. CNPSo 3968]|uniref:helix-turn-helix transcriptional regulator n=1 Tax=Rhizobium sp. CNPSo 3968 TaxID=3021408 RepID=UPI002551B289|nr:LuxR C-terminal-related transcriptional regulator [Rhizobium sp. CNPSo 3968]MDK4720113.1 LuxR C-terminal-related transcriptional regulator [Rhizobium sp. CNPSo 3968]
MTNPLNPAEVEILQKVADGIVLKKIAQELGIRESAVSNRLDRARQRVNGGSSTVAFVATALRCGWIH